MVGGTSVRETALKKSISFSEFSIHDSSYPFLCILMHSYPLLSTLIHS